MGEVTSVFHTLSLLQRESEYRHQHLSTTRRNSRKPCAPGRSRPAALKHAQVIREQEATIVRALLRRGGLVSFARRLQHRVNLR